VPANRLTAEPRSASPRLVDLQYPPAPSENQESTRLDVISYLTLAYVALLPFQIEAMPMLRIAPSDLFLVLAALFAPLCFRLRPRAWSWWHALLLLVFAMASMIRGVEAGELNSYALINKDAGLLVLFLSYAAITGEARSWPRMRRLIRVFVVSVVLQNLVGIVAAVAALRYGIDSILMLDRSRLCGMLVDPNAYGGMLVCAFLLAETASNFKPPFLFFTRITLAIGLALTFSRTAWIAFAVGLIALSITRFRKTLPTILTVGLGAVGLAIYMGSSLFPRFQDLATRSDGGRVDLVHDALKMFGQHPFFGAGLTSFQMHEDTIVHTTSVWFLTDFGLVGFSVFFGLMSWFFVTGYYAYRHAPSRERSMALGVLVAQMSMLTLSFGIDAFYQRQWWLIMALIGACNSIVRASRRFRVVTPEVVAH
jgi:putative inorganic carbon (hco3(-)) transporter